MRAVPVAEPTERASRRAGRTGGPPWHAHRRSRAASLGLVVLALMNAVPVASSAQGRVERSSGVTFASAEVGTSGGSPAGPLGTPARSAAEAPVPRQAAHVGGGSRVASALASGMPGTQPVTGSPWWTPLASAALPGAGQAVLKQDRFVAYMAVEGYFWLRFYADRREGLRQRNAYRELANDVARAGFSSEKPVGNFEYYERMEHFIESGVFDAVPGGSIQPETDTSTFNGSIWLLARRTYWSDPDVPPPAGSEAYLRAEALYRDRAVLPAYRWSWRDAQLEQDLYRRTISQSNEAFRRAVQDLGVVLANHVLSTVDAYVAVRLQRSATPERGYGLTLTVPWEPTGH